MFFFWGGVVGFMEPQLTLGGHLAWEWAWAWALAPELELADAAFIGVDNGICICLRDGLLGASPFGVVGAAKSAACVFGCI